MIVTIINNYYQLSNKISIKPNKNKNNYYTNHKYLKNSCHLFILKNNSPAT